MSTCEVCQHERTYFCDKTFHVIYFEDLGYRRLPDVPIDLKMGALTLLASFLRLAGSVIIINENVIFQKKLMTYQSPMQNGSHHLLLTWNFLRDFCINCPRILRLLRKLLKLF